MKYFLLLFTVFIISTCGSTYKSPNSFRKSNEQQKPDGPGCYANCLIGDIYNIEKIAVPEYTGINTFNKYVAKAEYTLKEASSVWEKKKVDNNCNSPDPKDCLVWCLVETDPIVRIFNIVTDTTTFKEFKITILEKKSIQKKGGYTEWERILCESDLTPSAVNSIELKLRAMGFIDTNLPNGTLDHSEMKWLSDYQLNNGLPIGNIDHKTVKHLGLSKLIRKE